MTYAIETEGTRAVGSTLRSTGSELRHCGTTLAYAGELAGRAIADDQPLLSRCLADFLLTHTRALGLITTAFAALGGNLDWAARSADAVERSAALELGARELARSRVPGTAEPAAQ